MMELSTMTPRRRFAFGFAVRALVPAALAGLLSGLAGPASAQVSADFSNPKIVLLQETAGDGGYWTTTLPDPQNSDKSKQVAHQISSDLMALRQRMMRRRVLETYVEFLSPLRLPRTYRVFASGCQGGSADSPYYDGDPLHRWMNLCYSFMQFSENTADYLVQNQSKLNLWTPVSKEQLIAGMFAATVLHETGHALFDFLNVPVFGREEDAADQMAAFIATQFDTETARTIIKGFAYFWAYEAMVGKEDPGSVAIPVFSPNMPKDPDSRCMLDPFCAFSDQHGTASQRMYNTLCIAYGGNPTGFQDMINAHWLPADRVKDCNAEYQRVRLAFGKTILPFVDTAQMAKVKARKWFQPAELQEK
jgi:Putative metallopeptidase